MTQKTTDRTPADDEIIRRARALGLNHLSDAFSEDILVAANVASRLKVSFKPTDNLTDELWPVMRVQE